MHVVNCPFNQLHPPEDFSGPAEKRNITQSLQCGSSHTYLGIPGDFLDTYPHHLLMLSYYPSRRFVHIINLIFMSE